MIGSVILISGIAVGINTVAVVTEKRDPFPALLAGGLLTTILVITAEANDQLARALAVLFLVATLLSRGVSFFTFLTDLVTPKGA